MVELQARWMALATALADQPLFQIGVPACDFSFAKLSLCTSKIGGSVFGARVPGAHRGSSLLRVLRRHAITVRARSENRQTQV